MSMDTFWPSTSLSAPAQDALGRVRLYDCTGHGASIITNAIHGCVGNRARRRDSLCRI